MCFFLMTMGLYMEVILYGGAYTWDRDKLKR